MHGECFANKVSKSEEKNKCFFDRSSTIKGENQVEDSAVNKLRDGECKQEKGRQKKQEENARFELFLVRYRGLYIGR